MAARQKTKMPIEERAKQFMPFSPLSGLGMAILKMEKEKVREAKKCLDADKEEEINRNLKKIKAGDFALITYFDNGEYIKLKGEVNKIDEEGKALKINDEEIMFKDIFDVLIQ